MTREMQAVLAHSAAGAVGAVGLVLAIAGVASAATVESTPTVTRLALSASKVTAGREQAEHLTVRVTPPGGGNPPGKVIVKAGAITLCRIELGGGTGTCTLPPSKLRPGTYHLVARYLGGEHYAASDSAKKTLTVAN
ncbi:MAG TPA: Ig-like domain-containing protein [Streptosporangiaceae bacterium]|nr:Ig-like domain-containing protein [Streptosporangiaceae bacterium]